MIVGRFSMIGREWILGDWGFREWLVVKTYSGTCAEIITTISSWVIATIFLMLEDATFNILQLNDAGWSLLQSKLFDGGGHQRHYLPFEWSIYREQRHKCQRNQLSQFRTLIASLALSHFRVTARRECLPHKCKAFWNCVLHGKPITE